MSIMKPFEKKSLCIFYKNSSIKSAFWSSSFKRFYFKGEEEQELHPGKISGNHLNKEKSWYLSELVFSSWGQVCTDTGTQVCCRGAESLLVREDPMKRSRIELWSRVPKIRQRLKLQLSTSRPFVIDLTFHSIAYFRKKRWTLPCHHHSCGYYVVRQRLRCERLLEDGVSIVTNGDFLHGFS